MLFSSRGPFSSNIFCTINFDGFWSNFLRLHRAEFGSKYWKQYLYSGFDSSRADLDVLWTTIFLCTRKMYHKLQRFNLRNSMHLNVDVFRESFRIPKSNCSGFTWTIQKRAVWQWYLSVDVRVTLRWHLNSENYLYIYNICTCICIIYMKYAYTCMYIYAWPLMRVALGRHLNSEDRLYA